QSGNLNKNTIVALSAKAKEQVDTAKLPEGGCDPEKNARYLIRRDIRGQAAQFLNEDIDDVWDIEQLRLLAEGSQWEQVITQATQFIVKTRGRTRLIDKGANLISKALNKFEDDLKTTEIAANDKLEEHKAKKKAAERSLSQFENAADGLVRRFEQSMGDVSMHGEGVGGKVQDELHNRLRKGKNALLRRLEKAIDAADQERQVRGAIRKEASDWMQSVITGWQVDVRAGQSPAMRDFYNGTLRGVETDIRRLLEEAIGQGEGLLRPVDFEIPKPSEHLLNEYQAEPMKRFASIDYLFDTLEKLVIFRPIRDGYEALRRFITGNPFDRNAWKKRLNDYLEALTAAFEDGMVEKIARDFLKDYLTAVVACIDKSKQNLREEYESRLKIREADLARTEEERRAMAKHAKDIRTRVIKPFQNRLEGFVEDARRTMQTNLSSENDDQAETLA
ncbi:MAG: hypothetical protein ABL888_23365, partial [Pirellulaceae bacterium]